MSARIPLPLFVSFPRQLIQLGARVGATDDHDRGATALHYAVGRGQLRAFNLLVKAGADLDAPDRSGATALHVACLFASSGDDVFITMAEVLIKSGANVHAVDTNRWLLGWFGLSWLQKLFGSRLEN